MSTCQKQAQRAERLLEEAEDMPRIRGRIVGQVCQKMFSALGQSMTTKPIKIDKALGLSALRAILAAEEVNKRRIMLEDWDSLWDLIPMRLRIMIPFFMKAGSIHVENPDDTFFRLGGELNSRVTQILLSEQEREFPNHKGFKELLRLMDCP